jgi:hypothetical protein
MLLQWWSDLLRRFPTSQLNTSSVGVDAENQAMESLRAAQVCLFISSSKLVITFQGTPHIEIRVVWAENAPPLTHR